jgi:hypothetical protein
MAEPVTVRLKSPIQFGSDTISELTFRKGRAGDMRGLDFNGRSVSMDTLMTVASRLSGQPTAVIALIDEEDCGEVFSIATGFIEKCLTTGS